MPLGQANGCTTVPIRADGWNHEIIGGGDFVRTIQFQPLFISYQRSRNDDFCENLAIGATLRWTPTLDWNGRNNNSARPLLLAADAYIPMVLRVSHLLLFSGPSSFLKAIEADGPAGGASGPGFFKIRLKFTKNLPIMI